MKKIVLTGGGTAGHVTPNIALLPSLKEHGYEISYIGSYTGMEKQPAVAKALKDSMMSIIVSALCFFAATFGVGMYSNIDMISSICILLARGAMISMFVVTLILPTMFMVFDKVICATSVGFLDRQRKSNQAA